jgi:uncharacterized membrane protein (DUF106 family)
MSLIRIFQNLVALDLSFLQEPPEATIFILLLSLVLGIVTSIVNRMAMNLGEYQKMTLESHRVRQEMMEAMKSGNKRSIDRAQKRQQELMGQQSKMTMGRMKISFFFMIPFLIIWRILGSFFGGNTIAYFPFDAPFLPNNFSVANWYILCSISLNVIISRILGLTFEVGPEDLEKHE